jgi:hypothetical protein
MHRRGAGRYNSDATDLRQLGGTQTEYQTPGNVQVNDAPPQVDYFPYAGGGT